VFKFVEKATSQGEFRLEPMQELPTSARMFRWETFEVADITHLISTDTVCTYAKTDANCRKVAKRAGLKLAGKDPIGGNYSERNQFAGTGYCQEGCYVHTHGDNEGEAYFGLSPSPPRWSTENDPQTELGKDDNDCSEGFETTTSTVYALNTDKGIFQKVSNLSIVEPNRFSGIWRHFHAPNGKHYLFNMRFWSISPQDRVIPHDHRQASDDKPNYMGAYKYSTESWIYVLEGEGVNATFKPHQALITGYPSSAEPFSIDNDQFLVVSNKRNGTFMSGKVDVKDEWVPWVDSIIYKQDNTGMFQEHQRFTDLPGSSWCHFVGKDGTHYLGVAVTYVVEKSATDPQKYVGQSAAYSIVYSYNKTASRFVVAQLIPTISCSYLQHVRIRGEDFLFTMQNDGLAFAALYLRNPTTGVYEKHLHFELPSGRQDVSMFKVGSRQFVALAKSTNGGDVYDQASYEDVASLVYELRPLWEETTTSTTATATMKTTTTATATTITSSTDAIITTTTITPTTTTSTITTSAENSESSATTSSVDGTVGGAVAAILVLAVIIIGIVVKRRRNIAHAGALAILDEYKAAEDRRNTHAMEDNPMVAARRAAANKAAASTSVLNPTFDPNCPAAANSSSARSTAATGNACKHECGYTGTHAELQTHQAMCTHFYINPNSAAPVVQPGDNEYWYTGVADDGDPTAIYSVYDPTGVGGSGIRSVLRGEIDRPTAEAELCGKPVGTFVIRKKAGTENVIVSFVATAKQGSVAAKYRHDIIVVDKESTSGAYGEAGLGVSSINRRFTINGKPVGDPPAKTLVDVVGYLATDPTLLGVLLINHGLILQTPENSAVNPKLSTENTSVYGYGIQEYAPTRAESTRPTLPLKAGAAVLINTNAGTEPAPTRGQSADADYDMPVATANPIWTDASGVASAGLAEEGPGGDDRVQSAPATPGARVGSEA
jgi:hypothetical protein